MSAIEHEIPVVQPAHQIGFMDYRQVREIADIKYLEEGEGVPILFLHGIGGGAHVFEPQLDHFSRRYRRRWRVERLNAWLQNFRRILTRHEYHPENYLGFVHLGCIKILLRQYL